MKDALSGADRLRVLVLTNYFPRLGRETFATYNFHQVSALAHSHAIRAVVPLPWTEWVRDAAAFDLRCRSYHSKAGFRVEHPIFLFPPKILDHWYGEFYLRSVRKLADRVIAEFRPDVMFSCWAHPDGWAAVQLGKRHQIPVVIKLIGTDVLVLSQRPRRRVRILEALKDAAALVVVSQDIADKVMEMGIAADRVHIVPEGLNKKLFCPGDQSRARSAIGMPAQGRTMLFVGNLLMTKGAGVLIDACALLRNRCEPFHCYLIGRGRDESLIRAKITQHSLTGEVSLIGALPQQQLPDWYRASDLVVLPSFSEGIPNVLREAVACGRPYVATSVGGIPEISKPEFAELVPPRDAVALADAICRRLKSGTPSITSDGSITWEQSASLVGDVLRHAVARLS